MYYGLALCAKMEKANFIHSSSSASCERRRGAHGAHDVPKRKTGDMDQVGFRAADFSQKTAKRTRASHRGGRRLKTAGKRGATKRF